MLTQDDIHEKFDWNDSNTYQWTYNVPSKDLLEFIGFLIGYLGIVPNLIFIGLLILSLYSETLAFWIAILGLLFLLFCLGVFYYDLLFGSPHDKTEVRGLIPLFSFITATVLLFIISSPLFFPDQFQGAGTSRLEWILYYLESILSVVSFDISSHIGVNLSTITPSEWIGTYSVSLFRSLLATGIIQILVGMYKEYFQKHSFYGSISDFYWVCDSMIQTEDITVTLAGKVSEIVPPLKMQAEDFLKVLEKKKSKEE